MRAVWALAAVLACAPVLPALPSQDGTTWYEIVSPHFTVWTDASASRGREIVTEMEEHRAIVARGLGHPESQTRILALALESTREAAAFMPSHVGALTIHDGSFLQPAIILYAYERDTVDKFFTHELTHAVSYGIVRHQPSWLAEGIATYFEGAQSHGGAVEAGLPRADRLRTIQTRGLLPTAELFTCAAILDNCDQQMFYATAWAMFTFLVNAHLDELSRYLARLDELPRGAAAQAWREVFPALPPGAELDAALHEFTSFGKVALSRYDAPPVEVAPVVRAMTDGEVAEVRAMARLAHGDRSGALADVATAERADPTSLLAALAHFDADQGVSLATAQAVAAAHATDWRAFWLLAHLAGDGASRDARDEMCRLAAADPSAAIEPELCAAP